MTILDDRQSADSLDDDLPVVRLGEAGQIGTLTPESNVDESPTEAEPSPVEQPIQPLTAVAVAFLATAAAAWMLGGIFTGSAARLVGLLGALLGGAIVAGSERWRLHSAVQLLALPLSIVLGVALIVPSANGGNPLRLVIQAIEAGGLSQPPVPFDPGWRFLLLVLACALTVTAAAAAMKFRRARLAALLPAPVTAAGVLLQPANHELISISGSLLLAISALAVAYGSELSRESNAGGAFEARRLLKAVGVLAGIVALIVGMSHLSFLYPPQQKSVIIPPKKPQTPPAVDPSQLLFSVTETTSQPLRTGVLDVYLNNAWLTPPYDSGRFVDVGKGDLPKFVSDRTDHPVPAPRPQSTTTATVTINDLGEARQVPDLANSVAIESAPKGLQFDPRTQTLQTSGRPSHGLSYTIVAAAPASSAALGSAPKPGPDLDPYLTVPAAPPAVTSLIASIPTNLNRYDRLQFVRNYYYQHAVASGPGNPVDMPPDRVAAILQGKPASPYEITAGEVLLARWAGIPARIGFGYYDQKPTKGNLHKIYPTDGAMWLEAYFPGSGWIPILGHPRQATSSLHQHQKNPQILPNGELVAQMYVPLEQPDLRQLYAIVQYWLVHAALPLAGIVLFLWVLLPGLVKLLRRVRRTRWAMKIGPGARIAAVYAEFRDRAIDVNVGHPTLTPLEFLDVTLPDEEHKQLAWLVTRALWGDLVRDQREEDAENAERLARSMTRRLSAGQPALLRVAAFASRASLRDPYTDEIPNLWWAWRVRRLRDRATQRVSSGFGRIRRIPRPSLRGRLAKAGLGSSASLVLVVLLAISLSGCGAAAGATPLKAAPLPPVPDKVGNFSLELKPSAQAQFDRYKSSALISSIALYGVRMGGVTVGTLQTAALKPGLPWKNSKVREEIVKKLGGVPSLELVAGRQLYAVTINRIKLLVHFMPSGQTYELLAAGPDFPDPESFFTQTLAQQEGQPALVAVPGGSVPMDPRRGWQ